MNVERLQKFRDFAASQVEKGAGLNMRNWCGCAIGQAMTAGIFSADGFTTASQSGLSFGSHPLFRSSGIFYEGFPAMAVFFEIDSSADIEWIFGAEHKREWIDELKVIDEFLGHESQRNTDFVDSVIDTPPWGAHRFGYARENIYNCLVRVPVDTFTRWMS